MCSEVCILITQKLVLHKGLCPHPCKMEKKHISSSPSCQAGIFTLAFSPQSIHRNAWCCWEGTAFLKIQKRKRNEVGQTKCLLSFLQLSAQRWRQPWWLQVGMRAPPYFITAKGLQSARPLGCRLPKRTAGVSDRGAPLPLGLEQCSELCWINTLVLSC